MAVAYPVGTEETPALSDGGISCLTFAEARNSIREKFVYYHQLLAEKELELITELDRLEAAYKPELNHVTHDLNRLYAVVGTWDDTLGTNTLTTFLERQRSVWYSEIAEFERSEKLLSHLRLKYSDFKQFVGNIIEIVPYRTKAKFRSDLAPLLELELKVGDEWFLVSDSWFSQFATSINFESPQYDDSWIFPESIPIDHSGIYVNGQITTQSAFKKLHSKAWNMLLGFHNLSPGSHPIKRLPFSNPLTKEVELTIVPITHKCHIAYKSGVNSFDIQMDMNCFPSDTFAEVLSKVSHFSSLITPHAPQFFCYSNNYAATYNHSCMRYSITDAYPTLPPNTPQINHPRYTTPYMNLMLPVPQLPEPEEPLAPLRDLNSQIGLDRNILLFLIPDSFGSFNNMQVVSNKPELTNV